MSSTGERYRDGRMAYRCDTCGLVGPWSESWCWFGSYLEDPGFVRTFCSDKCKDANATRKAATP